MRDLFYTTLIPSPDRHGSSRDGDLEKVRKAARKRCRRSTRRGEGGGRVPGIRQPLSYRNGVARSQPFNELGQLTLYAQSFPAFRFYVNFNSLRRTCSRKSVFIDESRAYSRGTLGQVYPRPSNRNRRNIVFPPSPALAFLLPSNSPDCNSL